MKPLELTIEHKDKLLEMCKVLFPEYVNIQFQQIDFLQFSGKHDFHIHWFEFCMTHLSRVLMCKNTKHMQQLFMGLKHPVDYLYEEFKKLNN